MVSGPIGMLKILSKSIELTAFCKSFSKNIDNSGTFAQTGCQTDTSKSLCDWLALSVAIFELLIAPSNQHQFESSSGARSLKCYRDVMVFLLWVGQQNCAGFCVGAQLTYCRCGNDLLIQEFMRSKFNLFRPFYRTLKIKFGIYCSKNGLMKGMKLTCQTNLLILSSFISFERGDQ